MVKSPCKVTFHRTPFLIHNSYLVVDKSDALLSMNLFPTAWSHLIVQKKKIGFLDLQNDIQTWTRYWDPKRSCPQTAYSFLLAATLWSLDSGDVRRGALWKTWFSYTAQRFFEFALVSLRVIFLVLNSWNLEEAKNKFEMLPGKRVRVRCLFL